jgi:hypothetical protein
MKVLSLIHVSQSVEHNTRLVLESHRLTPATHSGCLVVRYLSVSS